MGTANSTLQEGVQVEDVDFRRPRPALPLEARMRVYDEQFRDAYLREVNASRSTFSSSGRPSLRSVQSSPALSASGRSALSPWLTYASAMDLSTGGSSSPGSSPRLDSPTLPPEDRLRQSGSSGFGPSSKSFMSASHVASGSSSMRYPLDSPTLSGTSAMGLAEVPKNHAPTADALDSQQMPHSPIFRAPSPTGSAASCPVVPAIKVTVPDPDFELHQTFSKSDSGARPPMPLRQSSAPLPLRGSLSQSTGVFDTLESFGVPTMHKSGSRPRPLAEHLTQGTPGAESTIPFPAMRTSEEEGRIHDHERSRVHPADLPRPPDSFHRRISSTKFLRRVSQWSLSSRSRSRSGASSSLAESNNTSEDETPQHVEDSSATTSPDVRAAFYTKAFESNSTKAPGLRPRASAPSLSQTYTHSGPAVTSPSEVAASAKEDEMLKKGSPTTSPLSVARPTLIVDESRPVQSPELESDVESTSCASDSDQIGTAKRVKPMPTRSLSPDSFVTTRKARMHHRRSMSVGDVPSIALYRLRGSATTEPKRPTLRPRPSVPTLPHMDLPNLSSYPASSEPMQTSWEEYVERERVKQAELADQLESRKGLAGE